MKVIEGLLAEYAADHQNLVNQRLHTVCVPAIFISLVGLLAAAPVPGVFAALPDFVNWATLGLAAALAWYFARSLTLGVGMLLFSLASLGIVAVLAALPVPLALSAAVIFILAWIGQFIGHNYEGKRPSFFRDLRFLLVGPLWVLAKLYRRLGLRV